MTKRIVQVPLILFLLLLLPSLIWSRTDNWNQWNRPKSWGPSDETLKLYSSVGWQNPDEQTLITLNFGWEYFIGDRYSLYGSAGLPLKSELAATNIYPLNGGLNLHFIPKATFDVFFGVGGGLWIVDIEQTVLQKKGLLTGGEDKVLLRPALRAQLGFAYHFWGMLFAQVEAGYQIADFADGNYYQDYASPFVEVKVLGLYF